MVLTWLRIEVAMSYRWPGQTMPQTSPQYLFVHICAFMQVNVSINADGLPHWCIMVLLSVPEFINLFWVANLVRRGCYYWKHSLPVVNWDFLVKCVAEAVMGNAICHITDHHICFWKTNIYALTYTTFQKFGANFFCQQRHI